MSSQAPEPADPRRQFAPNLAGAPQPLVALGAMLAPLRPLIEAHAGALEAVPPAQLEALAGRLRGQPALLRLACLVVLAEARVRLVAAPDELVAAELGADAGGIRFRAESSSGRVAVFRL